MKFNKLFNEKTNNRQTEFEKLPDLPDPIKADQDLFKGNNKVQCSKIRKNLQKFREMTFKKKCNFMGQCTV